MNAVQGFSTSPFSELDKALAKRILAWHNTDDKLLAQTVMATSFALQQGHSCLSLADCLQELPYKNMTSFGLVNFPELTQWRTALEKFNLSPDDSAPLVLFNDRVYLRRYWQFESEIVAFLKQHQALKPELSASQKKLAKQLLEQYFPDQNGEVSKQKIAAANSLFTNFSTIIGGPGTGKTYTVTRILALLAQLSNTPLNIKLAAPTGKAAQRLAEAIRDAKAELDLDLLTSDTIPSEAQTLHRLLGVRTQQLQFKHNADNPIEADIILIDEVSMVDLPLMARLLRTIKPTTQLILLGDANQLPSVAAGSVLADLITTPHPGYSKSRLAQLKTVGISSVSAASGTPNDELTELTHSRRFHKDSGVGLLAKAVIEGNTRTTHELLTTREDLDWFENETLTGQLRQWSNQHYKPLATQTSLDSAFESLKAFRILCAQREGTQGVEGINQQIQKWLNPIESTFYKGQPIMVTKNHYGVRLYNGDVGLIWPNDDNILMAWFEAEGGYRAVALGRLPSFETVYAMTIHKTQGSEFSEVALVLPEGLSQLLTRELLYTGITRAKAKVNCLGHFEVLRAGVEQSVQRWAGLADRLAK